MAIRNDRKIMKKNEKKKQILKKKINSLELHKKLKEEISTKLLKLIEGNVTKQPAHFIKMLYS